MGCVGDIRYLRVSFVFVQANHLPNFFQRHAGDLSNLIKLKTGLQHLGDCVVVFHATSKFNAIADAAALGSEIRELMQFKKLSSKKIDFFLPESFEWLVLRSTIFAVSMDMEELLKNPVDYIKSRDFIRWERFFTHLLVEQTRNSPQLRYPKEKHTLSPGYLTDANMPYILNAMK